MKHPRLSYYLLPMLTRWTSLTAPSGHFLSLLIGAFRHRMNRIDSPSPWWGFIKRTGIKIMGSPFFLPLFFLEKTTPHSPSLDSRRSLPLYDQ
ncbi:hypothetical protein BDV26DRAFT_121078 [Aspergillus bertholletiae]|uniref:Uncharacterized protein n=1 Tax=Aspergillus bertholletiae TaxID=1226010 RepID=A0A5N7APE2_9EURO|nr:hypothetical protein BDV26DRAFT_121078 [Aspergillus bertholletiae]